MLPGSLLQLAGIGCGGSWWPMLCVVLSSAAALGAPPSFHITPVSAPVPGLRPSDTSSCWDATSTSGATARSRVSGAWAGTLWVWGSSPGAPSKQCWERAGAQVETSHAQLCTHKAFVLRLSRGPCLACLTPGGFPQLGLRLGPVGQAARLVLPQVPPLPVRLCHSEHPTWHILQEEPLL